MMKLNKNESLTILFGLRAALKLGLTIQEAISLQAETTGGKIGRVLAKASYLINKKRKKVADVFFQLGILSADEKYILENAGMAAKQAIDEIIKLRDIKGRFNKTLFSLLWFPFMSGIIGMSLVIFLFPKFNKPFQAIIEMAKIRGITGFDTSTGFWYIDHFYMVKYVLVLWIVIGLLLAGVYLFLRKYYPSLVYKIFKLAAYDDAPYILTYMRILHNLGVPPIQIVKMLYDSNTNPGWKSLFFRLKKAISKSKPVWREFKKFGFPNEMTLFMKYAEESKDFWGNIDNIISFAFQKSIDGNELLKRIWGPMSTYASYVIITYFLVGILMLVFQMQSIAISMQQ